MIEKAIVSCVSGNELNDNYVTFIRTIPAAWRKVLFESYTYVKKSTETYSFIGRNGDQPGDTFPVVLERHLDS